MTKAATNDLVTRGRFAPPVSEAAVRRDRKARGFTRENFVDRGTTRWIFGYG